MQLGSHFRRNVVTTSGFFGLRLAIALAIAFAYIIVAAGIQYAVVGILGESTFNYIVGGLLSLFLGAIVCNLVGSLIFMFVRGWHVSALAYASKIRKSHAPAVTVGIRAFAANIVGFGAVYGVRVLAKSLLSDFKDKLWDLLSEVPLAQNLQQVAENPIVEHLATDVLNYGFDATIFYLIKNSSKGIEDVTSTVLEGLKRYLYCLPSIMLTSISSYILFRFLPKLCKWLLIIWVLFTQGICAGILITVLMWPLFYILDNAFFSPLTMVMFISCFSKQCDEEVDESSPTVQFVNSVLEGTAIGTSGEDLEDENQEEQEPAPQPKPEPEPQSKPVQEEPIIDVAPDMSAVMGTPPPSPSTTGAFSGTGAPTWMRDVQAGGDGIPPREEADSLWDNMPLADAEEEEPLQRTAGFASILSGLSPGTPTSAPPPPAEPGGASDLASLLRSLNSQNIGQALDSGGDEERGPSIDDILSGGDF